MKVYFNNSCKICRSEINLYKKEKIEEIDWIDITNNSDAEKETSKKDKELLRMKKAVCVYTYNNSMKINKNLMLNEALKESVTNIEKYIKNSVKKLKKISLFELQNSPKALLFRVRT